MEFGMQQDIQFKECGRSKCLFDDAAEGILSIDMLSCEEQNSLSDELKFFPVDRTLGRPRTVRVANYECVYLVDLDVALKCPALLDSLSISDVLAIQSLASLPIKTTPIVVRRPT
jgi:hypothetical protein